VQISCTQGGKTKNFILQGASQKKKITDWKNKTRPHYMWYQPIYFFFFFGRVFTLTFIHTRNIKHINTNFMFKFWQMLRFGGFRKSWCQYDLSDLA
jgi:hypothetical protein